jgi:hypothetical protein
MDANTWPWWVLLILWFLPGALLAQCSSSLRNIEKTLERMEQRQLRGRADVDEDEDD